jgi:hypothetical protein
VWDNADLEAARAANSVMEKAADLQQSSSSELPTLERKYCGDYTK